MTEPSIERARRTAPELRKAIRASWRRLPLPAGTFDAVFIMFAAHELRRHQARVQLFREAARLLGAGGELILVEHVRDWLNFLAFGPGVLHFFPLRAWLTAAQAAGLQVCAETSKTPFVRVLVLRRMEG